MEIYVALRERRGEREERRLTTLRAVPKNTENNTNNKIAY